MPRQDIYIGSAPNDGTGDDLRTGGDKINDNFIELFGENGQVHMIPVLAGGMIARTSNGAQSVVYESASNKVMVQSLDFDKNADEFAQFAIPMPEQWNEGTVMMQAVWSTTAGSGDVVWGFQAVAIGNDDPLDAAFGSAVTVTDSVTAANDLMVSPLSSAITIAGSPAAGDFVIFQVYRDADNGSDTLDADAKLIAVRLYITTDYFKDG